MCKNCDADTHHSHDDVQVIRRNTVKRLLVGALTLPLMALGLTRKAEAGNGPCYCGCPGFVDQGSSVCGRCYHSWSVHS
jgi:hypothetical protein